MIKFVKGKLEEHDLITIVSTVKGHNKTIRIRIESNQYSVISLLINK